MKKEKALRVKGGSTSLLTPLEKRTGEKELLMFEAALPRLGSRPIPFHQPSPFLDPTHPKSMQRTPKKHRKLENKKSQIERKKK